MKVRASVQCDANVTLGIDRDWQVMPSNTKVGNEERHSPLDMLYAL